MSLLSRILIGIIVVGLAFIVGVRMYRSYEQAVTEQAAEEQTLGQSFSNQPPAARIQLPVFRGVPGLGEQEIYLEDAQLPADLNKEQAR
ncbi:MAG: hypothetical protein J6U96_00170 [Elusimicrobiaceae bacterium]|nr:hypothetical protein [Elusimicrobiaceae bacterium]